MPTVPRAEHFPHAADIGVRGFGRTRDEAFAQAATALLAAVSDIEAVRNETCVAIECEAPNDGLLLVDWLNALIYRMAVDHMLFGRFDVAIDGHRLTAKAWGERVDVVRHAPSVEPKGATYTALKVERGADGVWLAQCVVDV
jgi:SHS2 domain-containing protein